MEQIEWMEGRSPSPMALYGASMAQDGQACHDWMEGPTDRQIVDRHPCLPLLASRARSPSPMASSWRAPLAVGQGEDFILRVCWTQLPSRLTQAAPARGETLVVWPGHSGACRGQGRVSVCLCFYPKVSDLIRGAFLYYLLALWRVQSDQST